MESYVRSLHEFQQHVEVKYGLLLSEYQQLITELPNETEELASHRFNQEQEETYLDLIKSKDEEIHLLIEDRNKKDQVINNLKGKDAQFT